MGQFLFAALYFPVYSDDSWVSVSVLPTRLKAPRGQDLSPTTLHFPQLLAVCLAYIWRSINVYGLINKFSFMKTMGEIFCTHQTISGWWGCRETGRRLWSVSWFTHFGELFGIILSSGKCPPKSLLWRNCQNQSQLHSLTWMTLRNIKPIRKEN